MFCGILCKVFCFTRHFHNERLWAMFEKNLELASLSDFYGEVLSERKQAVLSLYYNEDLSLAEIAEEIGISRQGVRDLIKKAEEEIPLRLLLFVLFFGQFFDKGQNQRNVFPLGIAIGKITAHRSSSSFFSSRASFATGKPTTLK